MRRPHWRLTLGIGLMAASIVIYAVEYAVFRDAHNTEFYLLQDLAFLPISVLFVTLILSALLEWRDKRAMLRKLNMVIGAFYSEVGSALARRLTAFDPAAAETSSCLLPSGEWRAPQFDEAARRLRSRVRRADARLGDLGELRAFLSAQRGFMLALLQNPNLLEHESFTELLWAVMHLGEELGARSSLADLPRGDLDHLSVDIERAYASLIEEWLRYMDHLRSSYPYLYSLAVRTNPFDAAARAVIEG
jgi:hypothetical protein